ncbi:MAG: hypothetical protein AB8B73_07190 [Ekhidna sp.]
MKILLHILIHLVWTFQLIGQTQTASTYVAGEEISIIHGGDPTTHFLHVTHAFGSNILSGKAKNNETHYILPSIITKKSGRIDLAIMTDGEEVWKNTITIIADTENEKMMESYCGPKHLIVSKNDFAMITSTVLDQYDNPLPQNTSIDVNYLVDDQLKKKTIQTTHLLGYERVYAPRKSGFGAVSTNYENVGSKEFRLDFYPNDPENYRIGYERQHEYADGNQLISISTSTIKDRFGNQVDNGTMVYFSIIDDQNRISSGTSETINGVAQFQLPAPENATIWKVKSYIPNYAEASELSISFKESVTDFTTEISDNAIKVGPIKGFMGQFVREGSLVSFVLTSDDKSITYEIPTKAGVVLLDFRKKIIPQGMYEVEVSLGNIIKKLKVEVK